MEPRLSALTAPRRVFSSSRRVLEATVGRVARRGFARSSPSLPDEVAVRLIKLAGARATQDGVIVIFAQKFSSQPRNREDARARLAAMLMKAQERPKPRLATRPTLASRTRRLDEKTRRGAVKASRRRTTGAD